MNIRTITFIAALPFLSNLALANNSNRFLESCQELGGEVRYEKYCYKSLKYAELLEFSKKLLHQGCLPNFAHSADTRLSVSSLHKSFFFICDEDAYGKFSQKCFQNNGIHFGMGLCRLKLKDASEWKRGPGEEGCSNINLSPFTEEELKEISCTIVKTH